MFASRIGFASTAPAGPFAGASAETSSVFCSPRADPAPPDLTTIAARNEGAFPRAHVLSVIDGYTRMDPAEDMPEFGLLLRGPTVPVDVGDGQFTPVPRPLAALMVYLESIQR